MIGGAVAVCAVASCVFGSIGFVLSVPLVLVSLLVVPICRLPSSGALLGWFVWLCDYDYLLNVGGPETPLSNAIRRSLGISYSADIPALVVPPLLLMLTGCGAGLVCVLAYRLIKKALSRGTRHDT
jgi:hypothetical protein